MSDPVARRQARSMVRTSVRLEIKLRFGDHREFTFKTFDLSIGGTFVVARPPQPVGTLLRFELPLPGFTKPISGFGEVLWIRVREEGRDKPAGMGVQFRYLDEPGEDVLREFLARKAAEQAESRELVGVSPPEVSTGPAPLPLVRPKGPATSTATRPSSTLEVALWPPDVPRAETEATAAALPLPEEAFAFRAAPAVPPSAPEPLEPAFPIGGEEPNAEPAPFGEPRRRTPLLAGLAAALLAALGLLLWWQLGKGDDSPPSPTASTAEPSAAVDDEPPEVASAETPGAPAAGLVSGFDPDLQAAAPPSAARLTRLVSIRVGTVPGETIVVLEGDGPITAAALSRHRLGGERPRELLRLAGIEVPYEPPVTAVGSPELARIRTGHHPRDSSGELYVVFDLPSPRGGIHRLEHEAGVVRVYLRGP